MQVITHQFITFGCDHGGLECVGRLLFMNEGGSFLISCISILKKITCLLVLKIKRDLKIGTQEKENRKIIRTPWTFLFWWGSDNVSWLATGWLGSPSRAVKGATIPHRFRCTYLAKWVNLNGKCSEIFSWGAIGV